VVDIPNACCSLYLPTAIFDFEVRPARPAGVDVPRRGGEDELAIVPIYAFICESCGPFDLVRPVAQASEAAACPMCGGEARRVFSPPGLALLDRPMRRVLDLEEKSAR
jgi:putative FmdB family regulatory protein